MKKLIYMALFSVLSLGLVAQQPIIIDRVVAVVGDFNILRLAATDSITTSGKD